MRTKRTKRVVVAAAIALVLAGGAGTAVAVGGQQSSGGAAPKAAAKVAASAEVQTPASRRSPLQVVQPYQPVEIGSGAKMALLPEGRQNYVVAWDDIEESIEQAKGYAGDAIRPNSLSGGLSLDGADAQFTGAFRTDTVPARITVRVDSGAAHEAGMLRLPGNPGWGTYYYDAPGAGAPQESTEVTAYAANGTVLASLTFKPVGSGR
jgi:hypothetical protein